MLGAVNDGAGGGTCRLLGLICVLLAVQVSVRGALIGIAEFQRRFKVLGGGKIGEGANAVVYLGTRVAEPDAGAGSDAGAAEKGDEARVAIKRINCRTADSIKAFRAGLRLRAAIGPHAHIVKCLAAAEEGGAAEEYPRSVLVAEELMDWADLASAKVPQTLAEWGDRCDADPVIYRILGHVLLGLECMHSGGFVHRDIKPGNILASVRGRRYALGRIDYLADATYKIGDLETAATLRRADGAPRRPTSVCGTLHYMAPEVLDVRLGADGRRLSSAPHGSAADIWAVGLLGFELWTGARFVGGTMHAGVLARAQRAKDNAARITAYRALRESVLTAVAAGEHTARMDGAPAGLRSLVAACLEPKEERRPTAAQLLALPFIRESIETEPDQ